MNHRLLSFLALGAMVVLPQAARASTASASGYLYSSIVPPGADQAEAGFSDPIPAEDANPINSDGVIAGEAFFSQACGDSVFVYLPKIRQYLLLGGPPGVGATQSDVGGIADDNSVAVSAWSCSSRHTSVYRVTVTGTTPQWSKPCACSGFSLVGNNLDGIALNSLKLGAGILLFPNEAPKISSLATNVGFPTKAQITGVGTPSGFVGTQYTPKNHRVPTVWLDGKPYRLPVTEPSSERPVPFAMAERQTSHGLQIDIVGNIWHREGRYGPGWWDTDYWHGTSAGSGFKFVEKRHFISSKGLYTAYGISADGSMIFGVSSDDLEGLIIYFTASHRTVHGSPGDPGCGGYDGGLGWGDGHGDILVDPFYESLGSGPPGLCLAAPKH